MKNKSQHITGLTICLQTVFLCCLFFVSTVRAEIVNVSGQVTVSRSGFVFNRATNTYDTTVTLKNSLMPISAPITLIVTNVSSEEVKLANASGATSENKPYVAVPLTGGFLAPNQSSSKVILKFKNPNRESFTFQTEVFADIQMSSTPGQSITSVIESNGGKVELPGVASITLVPDTVQSAAIELAIQNRPEFNALLEEHPEYSLLDIPQLRIKSSATFHHPIYLKVPISSTTISSGQTVTVLALQESSEDGKDGMVELTSINASICEKGNAICATIIPEAFQPVPLDPSDPIIYIMLATTNTTSNTDALWTVPSASISPQATIQPTGAVTFGATLNLKKKFSFAQNTPVAWPLPTIGGDPFLLSRNVPGLTGNPHKGVDLSVPSGNEIRSVLPGTIEPGASGGIGGVSQQICGNGVSPAIQTIYGVKITHDQIGATRYLHTQQNPISSAGNVDITTHIATSDTSGTCRAHLHFDVYFPNSLKRIDPRPLLLNDMSLFLLPSDPGDSIRSPGFSFILTFKIDGAQPLHYLDVQESSVFAGFLNRNDATGGTVFALPGTQTVMALPSDENGRGANIQYLSPQIDLQQKLAEVVGALGDPAITTPEDLLSQRNVSVVLEFCSFRLSDCYPMATWNVRKPRELTILKQGNGTGTVTSDPPGIQCDSSCNSDTADFDPMANIELTATPDNGSSFIGWGGNCAGNALTTTVPLVASNATCTAEFGTGTNVEFYISVDDYVKLYIDGSLVASYDNYPWGVAQTSLNLTQGWHDITLEYKNRYGSTAFYFYYKYPTNTDYQLVPRSALRSLDGQGNYISGLKAVYSNGQVIYGEAPIAHGWHSVYQGQSTSLWGGFDVNWGKFSETLTGQIYIDSP